MNSPLLAFFDAMNGMNNLDAQIKPLREEYKVVGKAFTVKIPVGDNEIVLKAIKEARPGDVLVIDAKGDTYRAIAGDFVIGLAQKIGLAGIIVDGVIRDILGMKNLHFPVFCKGTTVAASHKNGNGEINVPISCGGVTISPGDYIIGDADGVIVIPQKKALHVLEKGREKEHNDKIRAEINLKNEVSARQYLENLFKS